MIVDMMRNDLGRVAVLGSVEVPALLTVERYPNVWQMTSTVTARTADGTRLSQIFAALHPSASVTGAPKVRTMEIVARARRAATRGLHRRDRACARRTGRPVQRRHPDGRRRSARQAASSSASAAASSGTRRPRTSTRSACSRGRSSASGPGPSTCSRRCGGRPARASSCSIATSRGFGRRRSTSGIAHRRGLAASGRWPGARRRAASGCACSSGRTARSRIEKTPARARAGAAAGRLAASAVDDRDRFLFHKTTNRGVYERRAQRRRLRRHDSLERARRGHRVDDRQRRRRTSTAARVTPPVACGLLAGTLPRRVCSTRARSREASITHRGSAAGRRAIWLINSVHEWRAGAHCWICVIRCVGESDVWRSGPGLARRSRFALRRTARSRLCASAHAERRPARSLRSRRCKAALDAARASEPQTHRRSDPLLRGAGAAVQGDRARRRAAHARSSDLGLQQRPRRSRGQRARRSAGRRAAPAPRGGRASRHGLPGGDRRSRSRARARRCGAQGSATTAAAWPCWSRSPVRCATRASCTPGTDDVRRQRRRRRASAICAA